MGSAVSAVWQTLRGRKFLALVTFVVAESIGAAIEMSLISLAAFAVVWLGFWSFVVTPLDLVVRYRKRIDTLTRALHEEVVSVEATSVKPRHCRRTETGGFEWHDHHVEGAYGLEIVVRLKLRNTSANRVAALAFTAHIELTEPWQGQGAVSIEADRAGIDLSGKDGRNGVPLRLEPGDFGDAWASFSIPWESSADIGLVDQMRVLRIEVQNELRPSWGSKTIRPPGKTTLGRADDVSET